jgi:hypothetical protein
VDALRASDDRFSSRAGFDAQCLARRQTEQARVYLSARLRYPCLPRTH